MRHFWIAFAATVVGLSSFGVASLLTSFRYGALTVAWAAAYAAVLVAAIVLSIRHKSRIAAAMFVGFAASFLVVMASCFAIVLTGI